MRSSDLGPNGWSLSGLGRGLVGHASGAEVGHLALPSLASGRPAKSDPVLDVNLAGQLRLFKDEVIPALT